MYTLIFEVFENKEYCLELNIFGVSEKDIQYTFACVYINFFVD